MECCWGTGDWSLADRSANSSTSRSTALAYFTLSSSDYFRRTKDILSSKQKTPSPISLAVLLCLSVTTYGEWRTSIITTAPLHDGRQMWENKNLIAQKFLSLSFLTSLSFVQIELECFCEIMAISLTEMDFVRNSWSVCSYE